MAQITEMTKPDHSAATARVKSADKRGHATTVV